MAAVAAGASLVGGWRKPSPLFLSIVLGFAGGVLVGTITLEMVPKALELGGLAVAAIGVAAGFGGMYAFDLVVPPRGDRRSRGGRDAA